LSVKLKHLDQWLLNRRHVAELYEANLADLPLALPKTATWATHSLYMYTILTEHRDALSDFLATRGISSQKIYATPVPMQPCYRDLEYSPEDIPVASRCAANLLSLPIFPELSENETGLISEAIHEFFEEQAK